MIEPGLRVPGRGSASKVRRVVEFCVRDHDQRIPHSAFKEETPNEMYLGIGERVPVTPAISDSLSVLRNRPVAYPLKDEYVR